MTDLGIFQVFYQGSPESTYMDVGNAFPSGLTGGAFPTYVADRGKFLPITQDPTTGLITVGAPVTQRTPWYIQSDFNFQQSYRISESKTLSFSATVQNLFNQRSVTTWKRTSRVASLLTMPLHSHWRRRQGAKSEYFLLAHRCLHDE